MQGRSGSGGKVKQALDILMAVYPADRPRANAIGCSPEQAWRWRTQGAVPHARLHDAIIEAARKELDDPLNAKILSGFRE